MAKFQSIIHKETIDTIALMKDVRLKQWSQPWFDGDILNSIRERDLALKNYRKTPKDQDLKHFKAMRNKSQNKIQKAKECYFKNKIEEDSRNHKKLWQTLKELGTSKKLKISASSKI